MFRNWYFKTVSRRLSRRYGYPAAGGAQGHVAYVLSIARDVGEYVVRAEIKKHRVNKCILPQKRGCVAAEYVADADNAHLRQRLFHFLQEQRIFFYGYRPGQADNNVRPGGNDSPQRFLHGNIARDRINHADFMFRGTDTA